MPTREEIEEIINQMKNNKNPGRNGITKENLKYGGKKLKEDIQLVIKQIWKTEEMPDSLNALLDVTYKLLASIIKKDLKDIWQKLKENIKEALEKEEGQSIEYSC